MTAEVAILNREAVALATDSAVTVGQQGEEKIYNTANKLFQLSATEPIAVMFYDSGAFGPIPWDTVVKEYRKVLSDGFHATVEEYEDRFIDFLQELVSSIPRGFGASVINNAAEHILDNIASVANVDPHDVASSTKEPVIAAVVRQAIDQIRRDELEPEDIHADVTVELADSKIRGAIPDWDGFVANKLGFPITSDVRNAAYALVRDYIRHGASYPPGSGVVFAGFGKTQLFPALTHSYLGYGILDNIRVEKQERVEIGAKGETAWMNSYAQDDMVQTFMTGVHPKYQEFIGVFIRDFMEEFIQHLEDQARKMLQPEGYDQVMISVNATKDRIVQALPSLFQRPQQAMWGPIMDIVDILTKAELAEMVEALVSLTSLNRRVTPVKESVGGPVDVAVISKGDGFVWVKRKHYFPRELNPRYFQRLYDIANTE